MKKWLLGLLAVLLFSVPVFAHPPITVYVDGEKLNFDQPPIIKEDRTLVPMRKIFEALDAQVFWDEPSQSVTALKGNDVFLLHIGKAELYKNGAVVYTMAVPAQIVNDRTLVPLRAVSESLGCEVAWDGMDYVIDIFAAGSADAPSYIGQDTPMKGGFSAKVKAPDGTVVLNAELKCDEVTSGKAATINGSMANETFGQGQAFLQTYADKALAEYAAKPAGFRPYYYMGTYHLTREQDGYTSFLASVTSYAGEEETVTYFSHTYDLATGREVDLDDLVSDSRDDLEYLWEVSFGALIDADPGAFYANAKSRLLKYMDEVYFYLTGDGITFYLSPDTIAPPETGTVSFAITYDF